MLQSRQKPLKSRRPIGVHCAAFLSALVFFVAFISVPSAQAEEAFPQISTEVLTRINNALQNLSPQSGRFAQRQANGTDLRGSYYMQWPSRLRFSYDGDGPVITVKDNFIAVQERPRAEPNWLPVGLTPLGLIRQAVASGLRRAMIIDATQNDAAWAITLRDPEEATPGQATLYFAKPDMTLYGWQLVDAQNLVTRLWLSEINVQAKLDERLFAVDYDEDNEE